MVELHGGTIWVESAPGRGSAFHVVLPLAMVGDADEDEIEGGVGSQLAADDAGECASARKGLLPATGTGPRTAPKS